MSEGSLGEKCDWKELLDRAWTGWLLRQGKGFGEPARGTILLRPHPHPHPSWGASWGTAGKGRRKETQAPGEDENPRATLKPPGRGRAPLYRWDSAEAGVGQSGQREGSKDSGSDMAPGSSPQMGRSWGQMSAHWGRADSWDSRG